MLEEIEINNYKMIDSLNISGFSNINILLGKNDCGKTSVLEAIFYNLGF